MSTSAPIESLIKSVDTLHLRHGDKKNWAFVNLILRLMTFVTRILLIKVLVNLFDQKKNFW